MISEREATPILFARDIERTAQFYGVRLGCAIVYPPPNAEVSLIVLFRSGERLRFKVEGGGIFHVRPSGSPHWHASVCIPDVDALATDFAAHGVPFATPPGERDGGLRGFEIADPDGNILLFTEPEGSLAAAPPVSEEPDIATLQTAKTVPAAKGAM